MLKSNTVKEFVKGKHNDTQHQNNPRPKTSPIDCDAAQMTNG